MGTFGDKWVQCMNGNGLPVPSVSDSNEALEIFHKLHQAWEAAGGEVEMTLGALAALGAAVGIDEAALAAIGAAAGITAAAYFAACLACVASVGADMGIDYLRSLFASGDLPSSVVAQLGSQGMDVTAVA